MQNKLSMSVGAMLKPVSFSDTQPISRRYRSCQTESSSTSLSLHGDSISEPVLHPFVPSKVLSKSHSLSAVNSLLNIDMNAPKSKAPNHVTFPEMVPFEINMTSMSDDDDIDDDIPMSFHAPPSLASSSHTKYCNELNSFLVENTNIRHAIDSFISIFRNFSDIDIKIDYEVNKIEGLVFLSNFCVFFVINLWQENSNAIRVEFRRTSGDALASAKFWAQIKTLFESKCSSNGNGMDIDDLNNDGLDFIALDLHCNDIDTDSSWHEEQKQHLSDAELDALTECLIDNDLFVVDELNFLYQSLLENRALCIDVLSHKTFMKELINTSLVNQDICVSRAVLMILHELANVKRHSLNDAEFKLFENINLLLNHQRQLIKDHTIRLLHNLLCQSTDESWNIENISRKRMIDNVKKFGNECNDSSFHEMIVQINEKLMM